MPSFPHLSPALMLRQRDFGRISFLISSDRLIHMLRSNRWFSNLGRLSPNPDYKFAYQSFASLARRPVKRSWVSVFLRAIARAFLVPTRTTRRFPRVTAV